MVNIETEDYLKITRFAKEAGITRQAVNKAIKEGRLKYIMINGIKFMHKKDLANFRK